MKPYYQDEYVTIYHGDARQGIADLPCESVDLVVTDPPYGLHFMGKDWDKVLPDPSVWRECLRVLKPGAFAFVMSSPRADLLSRMIASLEGAGFNVGFTPIYWAYASGFPKAQNIGKAVDKRNGVRSSDYYAVARYLKEMRTATRLSKADIDRACGVKSSCYIWEGDKTGQIQLPTMASYTILKRLLSLDDRFDELIEREGAEREVLGSYAAATSIYGNTMERKTADITSPATPQAQALDGSYAGFQPKPAIEVIIVAMKPLTEKTYVDQALANGHGVTQLDACRIPYQTDDDKAKGTPASLSKHRFTGTTYNSGKSGNLDVMHNQSDAGRFPANLLCSDDVLDDGTHHAAGYRANPSTQSGSAFHDNSGAGERGYKDAGSFSRYFDLDAWWAERIKSLPESVQRTYPVLEVAKPSKREKGAGNDHSTVKPLKLMSYLIELGSRPGDVVLDQFCGSGTTLSSAISLGRKCIGIDDKEHHCEIAVSRLPQQGLL